MKTTKNKHNNSLSKVATAKKADAWKNTVNAIAVAGNVDLSVNVWSATIEMRTSLPKTRSWGGLDSTIRKNSFIEAMIIYE